MAEPKNRLVQTRVPEELEHTLKDEARRRRTTVSQIIRNMLEDTFSLVDGVVANVDQIVNDSVELAQQVRSSAGRIGKGAAAPSLACDEPQADVEQRLAGILAWNEVVLNQSVPCTRCGAPLPQGQKAYMGLTDDPTAARAWLCPRAVANLGSQSD